MSEELKYLFTPDFMVSFRRARNISSYLVRATLYPVEKSVGSFDCKSPGCRFVHMLTRRTVLPVRLQEKLTKLIIALPARRNLLYLLTCNECRKQDARHTVDTFCYWRNNYRSNSREHTNGISYMQEHLCEHFHDSGHRGFLNDVSKTLTRSTLPTFFTEKVIRSIP